MVQYHVLKLNQAGKATNSQLQLPATMKLNDSKSLAGPHTTSSISTLMKYSSLNIQLTKCMRHLLTQKKGSVEKDGTVDLASKAWDECFVYIATNQKAVSE
jgi:hypothetical protein